MQKVHAVYRPIVDPARRRRSGFVEALMALRSRLAGRVGIEWLAPAQGFAYRPIALAEPVGLVEGWRFTRARIAADAGVRPYQSGLPGQAGREAWPRRRGRGGR